MYVWQKTVSFEIIIFWRLELSHLLDWIEAKPWKLNTSIQRTNFEMIMAYYSSICRIYFILILMGARSYHEHLNSHLSLLKMLSSDLSDILIHSFPHSVFIPIVWMFDLVTCKNCLPLPLLSQLIEPLNLGPHACHYIIFTAFYLCWIPRSEERRVGKECRSRWSP